MARRARARRADAERQAHAAKAARDEERQEREARIEVALADYYEARARVDGVREAARAKADAALADGERAATEPAAAMHAAIRTLRGLCDTNAEVADLCGLTVAQVRELLAATRTDRNGDGETAVPGQPGPFPPSAGSSTPDDTATKHCGNEPTTG